MIEQLRAARTAFNSLRCTRRMESEKNKPSEKASNQKSNGAALPRQKLLQYGGWILGGVMGLLLVGMMFGRQLEGVLNAVGLGFLYHPEGGVYADCSRAENKSNPYCISRRGGDGAWRNLKDNRGGGTGFSLN